MNFREGDQDTIFALSTPPGRGGIAILRVSGPEALSCVRKNGSFLPDSKSVESHRVYYGHFRSSTGEILDEVLASYFASGKSFTGEETVEISCHGSPVIVSSISEELVQSGCRVARRGEFTYRAFMNDRIDLVQAESVLGLIESKSKSAAKMSSRQLRGELSESFTDLENDLTWILANMEAGIDFSTEDIEPYEPQDLLEVSGRCLALTDQLLDSYKKGRVLSEGFNAVLVGAPNVGKSSLLNALAKSEHAIVTDIAGTTRDLVHAELVINGVSVKLTDTAGLRSTEDKVERIGIEKTKEAMASADMIFLIVDLSRELDEDELSFLSEHKTNTIVLGNKVDEKKSERRADTLLELGAEISVEISAKTGEGLDRVLALIEDKLSDMVLDDAPTVCNARQVEKLIVVKESIEKTNLLLKENASPEFISFELQCALMATKELLGKTYDDQVMDRVFKEFCIGK